MATPVDTIRAAVLGSPPDPLKQPDNVMVVQAVEELYDELTEVRANAEAGIKPTRSVRLATTANGTLASDYEAGDTVDGETLVAGDVVLFKDFTSGIENGPRVIQETGAPVRLPGFTTGAELFAVRFFVRQGATNGGKTFGVQNPTAPEVGTDPINIGLIDDPDTSKPGALDALRAQGGSIASATDIDIYAATGDTVPISGTTPVETLGTAPAGPERTIVATEGFSLVSGAGIITPNGLDLFVPIGASVILKSEGSNVWRIVGGSALVLAEAAVRAAAIAGTQPLSALLSAILPAGGGGVDLFGLLELAALADNGIQMLDEDGEIAARLDDQGMLSAAGGFGVGTTAKLEPIAWSGILLAVIDDADNVLALLHTDGTFESVWGGGGGTAPTPTTQSTLLDDLEDDFTSVRLVLIGDSITWGATASDIGPTTPRAHELADTRDILTSSTWANKLRKWLTWTALGTGVAIVESEPGCGEGRREVDINPARNDRITLVGGDDKTLVDDSAAVWNELLAVAESQIVEFVFRGDEFTVVFATQDIDTEAEFQVIVDGVWVATVAHYDATPALAQSETIEVEYGTHTVRIVNLSASQPLHLESIRHNRLIRVHNQGIYGTNTSEWVPGSDLLTGALSALDDWCMVQLGTNDRASGALNTLDNLRSIAEAIDALGVRVAMKVANAMPTSDATEIAGGGRGMDTIARITHEVASDLRLPVIDHYASTLRLHIRGTTFLADALHPNDTGHDQIFEDCVQAIIERRV